MSTGRAYGSARERADGDGMDGMVDVVARRDDVIARDPRAASRASDRRRAPTRSSRRYYAQLGDDDLATLDGRRLAAARARALAPRRAARARRRDSSHVYTPGARAHRRRRRHRRHAVPRRLGHDGARPPRPRRAPRRAPDPAVRRVGDGELLGMAPTTDDGRRRRRVLLESWTHIEVDRETSAEILDAVRADCSSGAARRARRDERLAADARRAATRVATELDAHRRRATPTSSPRARRCCTGSPTSTSRSSATAPTTSTDRRRRLRAGPGQRARTCSARRAATTPSASFARLPADDPRQGAREDAARADEGERALDRAPPDATSTTSA